ncbi:Bacterial transcriptional activator domain protein [Caloramator mitchellensis]|uniref:Bacterial transcriptional activator domain protein n=1 Tax=Caloramator mitchellensis TaxID=908809 RepID=A0A0R3JZ18_CALMK|nr:AAA family ATPase [Caloramator mitchellensis]KRQ87549.1 Bacterial transcriptional activator domain protein [Caloramator mitchellensis]
MRVKVKLFGIPAVTVENRNINFAFKKAEVLFYYMVLKREATRDELINLLWQGHEDDVARKNLRNAIYSVKKAFGFDVFISNNKSTLALNPAIILECDVLNLVNSNKLNEYNGEFLEGINIKECVAFEEWLLSKRQEISEMYIKRLYKFIEEALKSKDIKNAEEYTKKIIEIDEFDEKALRILMQIYYKKGETKKAVEIYNNFKQKLYKELGVLPDAKTISLYERLTKTRLKEEEKFFYGRDFEISKILDNFNKFMSDLQYKNIFIIGEAGIGKSRLTEEFLQRCEHELSFVKANCFAVEESYILKVWGDVLTGLSEYISNEYIPKSWKNILSSYFPSLAGIFETGENINFDANRYKLLEEIIIELISTIANKHKLIIILEDVHWMDDVSLSILKKIMLSKKNIFFILNSRYDKKINEFCARVTRYDRMEKIELTRFTREESWDFVQKALNGLEISHEVLNNIYTETEGNTFFIVEYINLIRNNLDVSYLNTRLQEILNSRFIDISIEGKKLLNIISMFYDEAPLNYIIKLVELDEETLLETLEELVAKFIIIEVNDKNLGYKFSHQKLREFVYCNLSNAKKRIMHGRIALLMEEKLTGDRTDFYLYSGLIYHFERAGEIKKALKYKMKNITELLNFSNELFPEVPYEEKLLEECNSKSIYSKLDEINNQLTEIKENSKDYKWLCAFFSYVRGRLLIWEGEYERGIDDIKNSIELTKELGDEILELKAIRQIIYYSIQVHDVESMTKYVEDGIRIANKLKNKKELAILFRLKGLNLIMQEKFNRAEEVIKHSLMIFESLNNKEAKYHFNIAASLNYLGNIRRLNTDFKSALNYYDKAIEICSRIKTNVGLTVFLTNAGQVSYELGDYVRAKDYLKRAVDLYKKSDAHWLRPIAEGYFSLTLIKEGRYEESLKYLKMADVDAQKLKSPFENGIVLRVKAEIKRNMDNNARLNYVFKEYLKEDLYYYSSLGEELLSKVKERYQVDILRALSRGV